MEMDVGPALRQATLDRGISLLGNARSLDPLFSTLHAGKPIVLGVFGASVAQNAGCLAQPHKRCMWYSGKRNVTRAYGRPSKRPFKGFAVRLYDHIQREFPHPDHQINNSALDATPVQVALPCLFSHMPVQMHLVLLDFGSMATNLDLTAIEGVVRALLSLKPPPALLLLSVQEWCTQHIRPRKLYQVGQLLTGQSTRDNVYPDTPWSRAETETLRVCQHYGQACVSVRRALEPHVYAHEANFSLHDVVGEDCLHPINGRYGVSYVAQLLTHWFDVALASWSRTRRDVPRLLRPKKKMKAPLYPSNEKLKPMRCYGFKARDDVTGQALHPIAWCSGPNTFGLSSKSAHSPSCWGMPENSCPSRIFRSGAHATKAFKEFVQDTPHFWFHCRYALSMASRKISPGVLGLVAGATLIARVDIAMSTQSGELGANRVRDAHLSKGNVMLRLEYLQSYEGMGIVRLTCVAGCACEPQRIDAHHMGDLRNVSVFAQHSFKVTSVTGLQAGTQSQSLRHDCELQLRILKQTSSGGHKFKVRSLSVGNE